LVNAAGRFRLQSRLRLPRGWVARQVNNEVARHEPDQNDEPVSFDLYAFPASGPRTVSEVHQLMEAGDPEDLRFDSDMGCWFPPPGKHTPTLDR
jgi:hypothetical protein